MFVSNLWRGVVACCAGDTDRVLTGACANRSNAARVGGAGAA